MKLISIWNKDKSVIFCAISAFAIGILTYNLPIAKGDDVLYLLSSISQGLAAIFALVFTITIFGAQMMMKFTGMDKLIDWWTKSLMIIFTIGIILPLIQLKTDVNPFEFNNMADLSLAIDLSLVTFCILAIIPYLMRVNRIIKYQGGISKLNEDTLEAIDLKFHITAANRLNELIKLGKNAAHDKLENETIEIVQSLKNIGTISISNKLYDLPFTILVGLKEIGIISIEKKLDLFCSSENGNNFVTKEILDVLKIIGVKIAKHQDTKRNKFTMECMKSLGINAIDNNLNDEIIFSSIGLIEIISDVAKSNIEYINIGIENISEIATKSYEKNNLKYKRSFEFSIINLWILGAFAVNYFPNTAGNVAMQLKKWNPPNIKEIFESDAVREKTRDCIKKKYPKIIDELTTFENIYDEID